MENKIEIKYISISEIKPYPSNPRKNDKAVEVVAKSIKEYGFKVPIILDKNNEIIAGHTRIKAAISLGFTEVPTIYADDLTPEQVKAFRIMDNKTHEYSDWDLDLLKEELKGLSDLNIDLDLTGFSEKELERIFAEQKSREYDELPPRTNLIINLGDIYRLGNHKIICGDSTDLKTFERLMKGFRAQCIFTDPPYNVDFHGTVRGQFETMGHDKVDQDEYKIFINTAFKNMQKVVNSLASYYVCIDFRNYPVIYNALENINLDILNCIVWDKIFSGMGFKYRFRHEFIVFAGIRNEIKWYGDTLDEDIITIDRQESNINFTLDMLGWAIKLKNGQFIRLKLEKTAAKRVPVIDMQDNLNFKIQHDQQDNIMQCFSMNYFQQRDKELSQGIEHPTMKPVQIIKDILINSTQKGDIVLDPFGGSGSTLIACELIERTAYLIEIDPEYVARTIERWEAITGMKAIKEQ